MAPPYGEVIHEQPFRESESGATAGEPIINRKS